ncbi:hypothetical protein LY15_004401 [Prauserella flava]|nr:hypothetical protein [Prauserella flava]MCR3736842.1 hypothetical protein [Prauserella salsuginis]
MGAAFTAAGVLNYRGVWRPYTYLYPYLGSGMLFMGIGVVGGGLVALVVVLVRAPSGGELPEALQWILTGVGFVAVLCFAAGCFFGSTHLPRRLRPPWMTDGEGHTVPIVGGVPAGLPRWCSAVCGTPLAASRGPVLTPEAVDWLYRGWSAQGWSRFAASVRAAPLRALGMVHDAGRPAPAVVLAAQPLHSDAVPVYVVAQRMRGEDGGEAAELIVRVGPRNAVALWQDEFWPTDQWNLPDQRSWRQRLGMFVGPGKRRRVNSAYRVDFVDWRDVGAWVADFVSATGGPGAVWHLYVDGDDAFELTPGGAPGEFCNATGNSATGNSATGDSATRKTGTGNGGDTGNAMNHASLVHAVNQRIAGRLAML